MSDETESIITVNQVICGIFYYLLFNGYPTIIDDDLLFTIMHDLGKECLIYDEEEPLPSKLITTKDSEFIIDTKPKEYSLQALFRVKYHIKKSLKYLQSQTNPIVINYLQEHPNIIQKRIRKP